MPQEEIAGMLTSVRSQLSQSSLREGQLRRLKYLRYLVGLSFGVSGTDFVSIQSCLAFYSKQF